MNAIFDSVMKSFTHIVSSVGFSVVACLVIVGSILWQNPAHGAVSQDTVSRTVVDLAGREVVIPQQVNRIVLGESRYIPALAILIENPISKIVGMVPDLKQTDPATYQQYADKFPEINDVLQVGHASADSFSVEQVLALRADVAIFGLEGHGPTARHAHIIQQLERAGVAIIFVDFRRKPLENTPVSMNLLGKVFGEEARAKAFTDFYQAELNRVYEVLENNETAKANSPQVFIHSRVGLMDLCCETMVRGMMADFSETVGGSNVAKAVIPGAAGVMNLEYLLTSQPDIYVATAVGSTETWAAGLEDPENIPPYVVLGTGITEKVARQSFQHALTASNTRGVKQLRSVQQGRAYAIWHHFYNTPLNVVAVQVFAKWLYPDAFADLDPKATMKELFARFQPVPFEGTYWVSLEPQASPAAKSGIALNE